MPEAVDGRAVSAGRCGDEDAVAAVLGFSKAAGFHGMAAFWAGDRLIAWPVKGQFEHLGKFFVAVAVAVAVAIAVVVGILKDNGAPSRCGVEAEKR